MRHLLVLVQQVGRRILFWRVRVRQWPRYFPCSSAGLIVSRHKVVEELHDWVLFMRFETVARDCFDWSGELFVLSMCPRVGPSHWHSRQDVARFHRGQLHRTRARAHCTSCSHGQQRQPSMTVLLSGFEELFSESSGPAFPSRQSGRTRYPKGCGQGANGG